MSSSGQAFLNPYRPGGSPLHRLDGRVKLPLALAFILTCSLLPERAYPAYILLLALALSAATLSGLGMGYLLKRSLLALPFLLAALPIPFTTPGDPLLALPGGFIITQPGLERFLAVGLKSFISLQAAILLAATTPMPDLLIALRTLRVPRLLVAVTGLMWRYLFMMVEETQRMLRGRAARSAAPAAPGLKSGGSLAWRGKVTGGMAGSLLLRSMERSERVYSAMLARGYDGETRTLPRPAVDPAGRKTLFAGLALLSFILLLGLLSAL